MFEEKTIEVEKLLLNKENYRIDFERYNTPSKVINRLFQSEKIIEMIQGIVSFRGVYPHEKIIVVPIKNGRYKVVEGNRRLLAIKAILGQIEVPEDFKNRVENLASKLNEPEKDNLRHLGAVVYDVNDNAYLKIIADKHSPAHINNSFRKTSATVSQGKELIIMRSLLYLCMLSAIGLTSAASCVSAQFAPSLPGAPGNPPPVPQFVPDLPPPSVVPPPLAVPVRPLTVNEFVSSFKPLPGRYEVLLLHPKTGCPVKVCFALPPGCIRRVKVNGHRIEFVYKGQRDVVIRFLHSGKVWVRG